MHEVERLVNVVQGHRVGDERVDLDSTVHVPVDDSGNVGAAAGAAEGGAFPDAAGDELEGAGGDLAAGLGDSDDGRDSPAAVAAFERLAHHVGIAGAVEAVIGAAVGQIEDGLDDFVGADLGRVDEVGHAEGFRHRALGRVDVHADDPRRSDQLCALDDVEADAAQTEDDDIRAGLDARGPDHRADAGGDPAAYVADLVERGVGPHLRDGDLGHHGEVGEG